MRPNNQQQNNFKRSRGRGRNKPQNLLQRSFESTGPDVKIRGTAQQIYERYQQYARDANSAGDRIAAENYRQHAEHYFRIYAVAQAEAPQQPRQQGSGGLHQGGDQPGMNEGDNGGDNGMDSGDDGNDDQG